MADIFTDKPQLGNKKAASGKKATDNITVRQMQSFLDELKHTGTVDFILEVVVELLFYLRRNNIWLMIIFLNSSEAPQGFR